MWMVKTTETFETRLLKSDLKSYMSVFVMIVFLWHYKLFTIHSSFWTVQGGFDWVNCYDITS